MSPLALLIVLVSIAALVAIAIIGRNVVAARQLDNGKLRKENALLESQLRVASDELRLIAREGGPSALGADLALEKINTLEYTNELTGGNK